MRAVRPLAAAALAAFALAGCSSPATGSGAPPASNAESTVHPVDSSTGGFETAEAEDVLLTPADLPGYTQLPDAAIEQGLLKLNDLTFDPSTVDVQPAECVTALAAAYGGLQPGADLKDQTAVRVLYQGSTPADFGAVVEAIAPTGAVPLTPDQLQVPAECASVVVTSGDKQAVINAEQLPVAIGSASNGLKISVSSDAAPESFSTTVSIAVIQEPVGTLVVATVGPNDVEVVASQAYDKALPVLK